MGWFSDLKDSLKDLGRSVVKGITNLGKSIFNFVGDVFSFVMSPFGGLGDIPDPNTSVNAGQQAQGVTVTKNGTNVPIPVVYGYRRIGGSIVFAETNGSNNKYLYVCYTLCQGEIKGIRRLFIQDIELPTSLFTGTDNTLPNTTEVTVNKGRYKGLVKLQAFNGSSGEAQSTLLNGSASWGKKRRTLPGIAYLAARFEFPEVKTQEDQDANPFSGGIPTIQAEVYGKKVYDIAPYEADSAGVDLTGSYSTLSKNYSINPVNHLLDYMIDPNFGCGLELDEIDADAFARAANKMLQYVTFYGASTGRAMTGNSVIDTSQKLLDNTKILLQGCRGLMPYVQGKYRVIIEDGGHPTDITSSVSTIVYAVDDDDIIDTIEMRGEGKNSKYNQVVVNYIDPSTDFQNQSVTYPDTNTQEYVDAFIVDRQELKGEFNFPTVTNRYIANDLARMIFLKSRGQRQISFTAQPDLMTVVPGDIIQVTNTRLNLSNQNFRVVGMNIRNDSTVSIEAVEHDATTYPYIYQDEADVFEQPKQADPYYSDPIVPFMPEEPYLPPVDPDPNPINPGPDDPPADSNNFPETPRQQGPVPAPAPDETQIPDPTDMQVKTFSAAVQPSFGKFPAGLFYNNNPSARAGSSQEHLIDDVFTLRYFDSKKIYSKNAQQEVSETPNIEFPAAGDFKYYDIAKHQFDKDNASTTITEYRNHAVANNPTQSPNSLFQPIVDSNYAYTPYLTKPLVRVGATVPNQGYETPDIATIDDQLYDEFDTAGFPYTYPYYDYTDSANQAVSGMRITFDSAHGLTDGVRVTFQPVTVSGHEANVFNFLKNYVKYVKVVDSTTIELYNRFNQGLAGYIEKEWQQPFGGFFYGGTGDKYINFTSVTGSVKMTVVSAYGSGTSSFESFTPQTFEKLKRFPNCSIYNPYEAWTRNQNISTTTDSATLGQTPTVEFEAPADSDIIKRGPKGLYPKVFINPPTDYTGIVIYRGTVAGGMIQNGGYYFNMANDKFADELGMYAWPWCGGNEQGFNPALLVQSPKDFFKIRFTDTGRRDINNVLLKDGSTPTSNVSYASDISHDPAMVYDLPGWTYRDDTGEFVTGYGIEAYLNYSIQQLTTADFEANETVTTSHALGG